MFIRTICNYMQSNLFILLWRRKLSVLLVSSSLLLLGLWTWALFNGTYSSAAANGKDKLFFIKEFNSGSANKNEYLIQKLISQANRVLRYQRQQGNDLSAPELAALSSSSGLSSSSSLSSSGGGNKNSNKIGSVQFVKPTQNPVSTSLVERRKKSSAGGAALGESFLFEEERLKILQNQQKVQNDDNVMDYERILSSAERQSQYEHELQRMGVPIMAGIGPGGPHPPNERLVHLDLKGAPPKLSFLKRLLPIVKTLGATGILIEYEDMFPYTGSLQPLAALNAYKPDELKDFLESVAMHGLTVMPLVQTFGHMEFALKLQGFEHMREIPESPQSICPSQKVSMSFLQDMLTQVIEFHLNVGADSYLHANNNLSHQPDQLPQQHPHQSPHQHHQTLRFSHIHIGCDEVARMGECDKCRQHSRNELFLSHVTAVASFVRAKWPQLKVVIWDDMLRDMTLSEMQHSHIGNYVEPMIWVYASDIYRFIQPQLWDMYSKVFPTAWGASAFKGAFGESLMIPFIQRHLDNNMRWLAVIAREGGRFSKGFKGLALTGWQRYDHFATLCELLPIGMPSLITSLATVSKGYFEVDPKENDILKVLECSFHADSRNEVEFYTIIMPELIKFQKTKTDNFFKAIPKCFLARQDLLIMEDLRTRGFKMPDRKKGLTIDQAKCVLKEVATLHSLSLGYKFQNPKQFDKLKKLITEGLFCPSNELWYKNYYEQLTKNAINMVSDVLPSDSKYICAIKEFAESSSFFSRMVGLVNTESPLSAICHGDCWANNFLYKYDTEGNVQEVSLVDFQLIRYSSIALDIANLLFCCTSKSMRDEHLASFIKHYTTELYKSLKVLCELPEFCDTEEKLEKLFAVELKTYGRFALGLALDIIPISTCSSEDAPDLYLVSRTDSTSGAPELNFPPNDLCRQKMSEVLIDMVDGGML